MMKTKFDTICQTYMPVFMAEFGVTALDAAAVFGNGGYESNGFETLQEIKPVVAGSRGGFGWFQWTGPRRRAFEAFCKKNGLNPKDDNANYLFLVLELHGPEKSAIAKLKAAKTLDAKTVAFEAAYERAGVKAHEKRKAWALKALHAYEAGLVGNKPVAPPVSAIKPSPPSMPQPFPQMPPPPAKISIWVRLGYMLANLLKRKAP
jgi:hypothetical protein